MPQWTDIDRPTVSQLFTADALNQYRLNTEYLHNVNWVGYFHDGSGSDWTINTVGVVQEVGSVFNITLTTTGSPVTVIFSGTVRRPNDGSVQFAIRTPGELGNAFVTMLYAIQWRPVTLIKPYHDLPAGEHTFSVLWVLASGSAANAATLQAATKPFVVAIEGL